MSPFTRTVAGLGSALLVSGLLTTTTAAVASSSAPTAGQIAQGGMAGQTLARFAPRTADLPSAQPVKPRAKDVAFPAGTTGTTALAGLAQRTPDGTPFTARGKAARAVRAEVTSEVAVVGVTWASAPSKGTVTIQVRTLRDGTWSAWEILEDDDVAPAETGQARGRLGTDPYTVIDVTAVEAVALTEAGTNAPGLRLTVIDPGTSPADSRATRRADGSVLSAAEQTTPAGGSGMSAPATSSPSVAPVVTLQAAANTTPLIYSRQDWGADPSLLTWAPDTWRVQAAVIHHTAGSNAYTSAQVPAQLRGIYYFHAVTRDWGDIGYNVLVDKFGRAWEGRAGGVTRATRGAHAMEYNRVAFGISVMGDYSNAAPSAAAFDTVARIVAWKFTLAGVTTAQGTTSVRVIDPSTKKWTTRDMRVVSAHRNVAQTACPGNAFYAQMPQLVSRINGYIGSFSDRVTPHDLSGDGKVDLLLGIGSDVAVANVDIMGTERPMTSAGWVRTRQVTTAGDKSGDRLPDLFVLNPADASLVRFTLLPDGRLRPAVKQPGVYTGVTLVAGGADLTRDGRTDLLGFDATTGRLWLYAGSTTGVTGQRTLMATLPKSVQRIALVPNFYGGRPGVLFTHNTYTYVVRLTSTNTASGWFGLAGDLRDAKIKTGAPDVDGDGIGDLLGIRSSGAMVLMTGNGQGGVKVQPLPSAGDMSGRTDFAVMGSPLSLYEVRDRTFWLHPRILGGSAVEVGSQQDVGLQPGEKVIAPGDWNGDRVEDLMVARLDGSLELRPGIGGGVFSATAAPMANVPSYRWNALRSVAAGGNWVGDGTPSLLTLSADGYSVVLQRGDGRGGFVPGGVVQRDQALSDSSWNALRGLGSGGQLKGRGAIDLVVETGGGALGYMNGNGAGRLLDREPVSTGRQINGALAIVGGRDYDGDAQADLIVVQPTGDVWLGSGNGSGGFLRWRVLGQLPDGTTLAN